MLQYLIEVNSQITAARTSTSTHNYLRTMTRWLWGLYMYASVFKYTHISLYAKRVFRRTSLNTSYFGVLGAAWPAWTCRNFCSVNESLFNSLARCHGTVNNFANKQWGVFACCVVSCTHVCCGCFLRNGWKGGGCEFDLSCNAFWVGVIYTNPSASIIIKIHIFAYSLLLFFLCVCRCLISSVDDVVCINGLVFMVVFSRFGVWYANVVHSSLSCKVFPLFIYLICVQSFA